MHELFALVRRELAAVGGRIYEQQSGDFGGVLRRVLKRDDATATVSDEHEAFEPQGIDDSGYVCGAPADRQVAVRRSC